MARSIVEISKMVGCSTATVSRALNNSGTVSPELRAAVLKVARETNYVTQRKRKTRKVTTEETAKTVEVVLFRYTKMERLEADAGELKVEPLRAIDSNELFSGPYQLTNSFYRRITDGILRELEAWQHKAIFRATSSLTDLDLIQDVNRQDLSGVLLFGQHSSDLTKFLEQCIRPLVLVDIILQGRHDVVTTDNLAGISAAFDHLYELGHRKIGFIGRLDEVVPFRERYMAFRLKLASADLPFRNDWVYSGSNHIDETAEGVTNILKQADRPTALLCVNDCAAFGVMRAAAKLNIPVPQKLSVVGFDDQDAAAMVTPALTTVHVPMEAIGMQAVRQLLLQTHRGESAPSLGCNIRLRPDLVVRQSTAPCKA